MRYRVITATPASKRLVATVAYRLLKVRTQGQNADVEVEVDDSLRDIGAFKIAHAVEKLTHSQRAEIVAGTLSPPTCGIEPCEEQCWVLCQHFIERCIDRSH